MSKVGGSDSKNTLYCSFCGKSHDAHRSRLCRQQLLQTEEPIRSAAFSKLEALFRDWYAWTLDLPGTFFLEAVEKLYKRNELASGDFIALGQRIDLGTIRTPLFMLAARDDELTAPQQLFAAEHLVSTPSQHLCKVVAPCRHVGLFMGKSTLKDAWPRIVRWIGEPPFIAPEQVETQAAERIR